MSELRIRVGEQFVFIARLEEEDAPLTCAAFSKLLPFQNKLIHARWSGEATWIPLANFKLLQYPQSGPENAETDVRPPDLLQPEGVYTKKSKGSSEFTPVIEFENHTSHPGAGQLLFYPGGLSETEILFPYGSASFSSKVGQLAGNHFLTIISGNENLKALGRKVLWEGAQDIVFEKL